MVVKRKICFERMQRRKNEKNTDDCSWGCRAESRTTCAWNTFWAMNATMDCLKTVCDFWYSYMNSDFTSGQKIWRNMVNYMTRRWVFWKRKRLFWEAMMLFSELGWEYFENGNCSNYLKLVVEKYFEKQGLKDIFLGRFIFVLCIYISYYVKIKFFKTVY